MGYRVDLALAEELLEDLQMIRTAALGFVKKLLEDRVKRGEAKSNTDDCRDSDEESYVWHEGESISTQWSRQGPNDYQIKVCWHPYGRRDWVAYEEDWTLQDAVQAMLGSSHG